MIFKTFLQFFIIFFLFIVAFAISFYLLLQNQDALHTPFYAIMKTWVMMTAEVIFDTMFHAHRHDASDTAALHFEGTTFTLYIIFLIVMTIIVMNLLTGLAVTDVAKLQENSHHKMRTLQLDFAMSLSRSVDIHFQQFLPNKRPLPTEQHIHVNHKDWKPIKHILQFFDGPLYMGEILKDSLAVLHKVNSTTKASEYRGSEDRTLAEEVQFTKDRLMEIETQVNTVMSLVNRLMNNK